MARYRFVDLSVSLRNGAQEPDPPQIEYIDHAQGARRYAALWDIPATAFEDGKFAAVERVSALTHNGTHVDAPWHYGDMSEGARARTIDELPLEWFFNDGVVLDMRHKRPGDAIEAGDLQAELHRIGYRLKSLDIVLIHTGTARFFNEPGNWNMNPGMTRASTLWLIDQGIRVMGIDAWGWDRPFDRMIAEAQAGARTLWEAHYAGKQREYCQIEKLCNLEAIPCPFGFKVAVFPVKIAGASAGWARPVAIIDEDAAADA